MCEEMNVSSRYAIVLEGVSTLFKLLRANVMKSITVTKQKQLTLCTETKLSLGNVAKVWCKNTPM